MPRTLPAIHELLCDMMEGKCSGSTASLSHVRSDATNTSGFNSHASDFASCDLDVRPSVLSANSLPFDRIIPKLTHMEEEELEAPPAMVVADRDCVKVDGNAECLSGVKAELAEEMLWRKFYEEGHEMVVTKQGRCVFPGVDFKLSGLSPDENYEVAVNFVFADEFGYRFSSTQNIWCRTVRVHHEVGPTAVRGRQRYFVHPMSFVSGKYFTTEGLSFETIRISNHLKTDENMIYLPTLRKYRIQLIVTKLHCTLCECPHTSRFDFPLTEFITVSNYNNIKMKQLKIRYNPYAKAFRDEHKKSVVVPLQSEHNKSPPATTTTTQEEGQKRKREDSPAASPPAQSPTGTSKLRHCESSTNMSHVPIGYIDLTRALLSLHEENRTVVPRDTCTTSQPTELITHRTPGDHYPGDHYPGDHNPGDHHPEHSRPHYTSSALCETPDAYLDKYPAAGTWEVNNQVVYTYGYYDNYYGCNYSDQYRDSNFDDRQAVAHNCSTWSNVYNY